MFDLDHEQSMREQLPVTPTVWHSGRFTPEGKPLMRFSRVLHNGKPRLRHPETGGPLVMDGDIKNSRPKGSAVPPTLKLRWGGEWVLIPSLAEFQEWTMDSVCPTPDGDMVEPDAPNSWLSLVGLV